MDFFEVIKKRRSVRKFTTDPIPESVMTKALTAALVAPNSSNLQPWEFYWVRDPDKKRRLVEACFSQSAASSARELVVAVSRVDTWKRNRKLLLQALAESGPVPKSLTDYYGQIVPLMYQQDPIGVLNVLKSLVFSTFGLFKPAPRRPTSRADLFEVVTKTTALACENLMLALVAQGYDSCPMEGFDEWRVKRLLKLGRHARVVMVIAAGKADPSGIWGDQLRLAQNLFIHEV